MSPYDVQVTSPAVRALGRLPAKIQEVVIEFIYEELAYNPQLRGRRLGRELTGEWRARRGDWRIIYRVDDEMRVVTITHASSRADAYRRRT